MSVLNENIHRKVFLYSLLLIGITLPFAININSLFIIILALNWLMEGRFREKIRLFFSSRTALVFAAFYLLHLAGMLYTENMAEGRFELEKKLSLLIIPLLLSTTPSLQKKECMLLLRAFVFSCTAAAIICLCVAVVNYAGDKDLTHFFYHDFSMVIRFHAVYFSLYLGFCIFILFEWFRNASAGMRRVLIAWMIFLLLIIFLLASKIMLLTVFLLINGFLLVRFRTAARPLRAILSLSLLNILLAALVWSLPVTRERLLQEFDSQLSVVRQDDYKYSTPFTGTSLRLVFWKFCLEILNEKNAWLTGVGTGDGQDLLDSKYRQYHLYTGYEGTPDHGYLGYNAHNQYINTLLCLGIPGLLLLLGCFVLPLLHALKKGKLLLAGMLLMFAFFSLTETTLATHKGVVFFTFFTSLLLFHFTPNDIEK
jgi:O-antigen ligase